MEIPERMQQAIARQAEAERNRRAKVINAEGEFQAADRLAQAADVIRPNPVTMQLRYLQALTDISSNQASTIVFPLPLDLIKPLVEPRADTPEAGRARRARRRCRPPSSRAAGAAAQRAVAAAFFSIRFGSIRTTSQARPRASIARITSQDGSTGQRLMPCEAEVGKAWWLLCHDSPSVKGASQSRLREWSSVSKRRRPKKWQSELML